MSQFHEPLLRLRPHFEEYERYQIKLGFDFLCVRGRRMNCTLLNNPELVLVQNKDYITQSVKIFNRGVAMILDRGEVSSDKISSKVARISVRSGDIHKNLINKNF